MRVFRSLSLLALLAGCAPAPTSAPAPSDTVPPTRVRDPVVRPVTPGASLNVVVMGDQGTGQPEQKAVAHAMQTVCDRLGCDLGFGLGDNFYPRGPASEHSPLFKERFTDRYGLLRFPFLMITGNHDESLLVGGDGADSAGAETQIAYAKLNPQWIMPDRYYRALLGDLMEVLAVDTAPLAATLPSVRPQERPGGSWASAQQAWLTRQAREKTTSWTVVLGHHPLFSNGQHGDAGTYDRINSAGAGGAAVRTLYRAACRDVDVIFSGHDHALQLFAPQPDCPGTWQVVSGAAGQTGTLRRTDRPALFQQADRPGFVWLKVTKTDLHLRFYTVGKDGAPSLAFEQTIHKPGNSLSLMPHTGASAGSSQK